MAEATPRLAGVRRVAVLKAGGIGDLLFALPALHALRDAYPDAEITLLTARPGLELFAGRPGPVDRAVEVPPFEGEEARTPEALERLDAFAEEVRGDAGLDLAVQLHGGGANSNPFVQRLGARVSVGLRDRGAPPLDRNVPYDFFRNEVLRALEVASLAGAPPVALEPRIAVTPADLAASRAALPSDGRPLAVLHPGAGDPRRRWEPASFAAVGRALAAAGAQVAVTGAQREADVVRAVVAEAPSAVDLFSAVGLGGLVGLLARASVMVANDSGPLHLAAAAGAATVGVYWCGNLINAGPMTASRHRAHASWRLCCTVCGADCMGEGCAHEASFVADVPVEPVAADALELLGSASERRGRGARTRLQRPLRIAAHPL